MAQQTAANDEAQTENTPDPELAAYSLEQAADSLQALLTRSEMRSAAREWDTRKSGTKQEMADSMLADAQEQALALLVEEGVELGGDLTEDEQEDEGGLYEDAEGSEQEGSVDEASSPEGMVAPDEVPAEVMDEVAQEYGMGAGAVKGSLAFQDTTDPEVHSNADEAALEARQRAAQEDEDEADEQDSSSGRSRTTVGEMLARDPAEYHRDDSLGYSEKQVGLLAHAMQHPDSTDEDVAEAVDCSARYANSVCHRWDASDEGLEALEDAGHEVPEQFQEVGA